jgi:hypothetical protein
MNKNLNLLRSRKIDEEGDSLAAAAPTSSPSFTPIDEESDSMALLESDEVVPDDELPFDELVAEDEDLGEPTLDDTFQNLVDFEEPMDALDSPGGQGGFSPLQEETRS